MEAWDPERYDADLAQGLSLAGENADYFAQRRAQLVAQRVGAQGLRVARICEVGCGLGRNLHALARVFPDASLVGTDTSAAMVAHARAASAHPRISFEQDAEVGDGAAFELVDRKSVV